MRVNCVLEVGEKAKIKPIIKEKPWTVCFKTELMAGACRKPN